MASKYDNINSHVVSAYKSLCKRGYTVVRVLGEGISSIVFLAVDDKKKKYAIKFILIHVDESYDDTMDAIDNELVILKRTTKHKFNTPKFISGYQDSVIIDKESDKVQDKKNKLRYEYVFFILEYIKKGIPLGDFYYDHLPSKDNIQTWQKIFLNLCQIMEKLHKLKIIHLDLHAYNILVDHKLDIYVLDFGLSYYNNLLWIPIGGKLSPPEHYKNKVSEYSDVYQLGLLMAEIITKTETIDYDSNLDSYERSKDILKAFTPKLMKDELFEPWGPIVSRMIHPEYTSRPTMKEVLELYEK